MIIMLCFIVLYNICSLWDYKYTHYYTLCTNNCAFISIIVRSLAEDSFFPHVCCSFKWVKLTFPIAFYAFNLFLKLSTISTY